MTVPSTSWNENVPDGSEVASLGDDRIRELKTQTREVVDIDHQFNSSGQDADNGKHKKVSLLEQADLGSGAQGKPILGAQTTGGKAELVFTDEDDNDVQITNAGNIRAESLSGVYPASALSVLVNIMNYVHPVGSIYENADDPTNPAILFGVGTWVSLGAGRVLVGIDSGDTDFDTAGETGGSKTHTLTVDEMPSHSHNIRGANDVQNDGRPTLTGNNTTFVESTESTGGDQPHNNLQPYIVVYRWKRTA